MKRTLTWIAVAIVVTGLIIWLRPSGGKKYDAPHSKEHTVAVEATLVSAVKPNHIIKVSGNIMSNEEVNLQSQIAGVVTEVNFKEGSHVHKGDLLVKIDDAPYQAQLLKDEATKQLYQVTLDRTKKLLDIKGVSQQDYDVAESNLNSINADIKLIGVSIGYCTIPAPFDGIVGLKNISQGSYITTGTVIADFEEISPVKVDFYVPEKYADVVTAGDSIHFSVTGHSRGFSAVIYAIDPKIDLSTGEIHLRAMAPNRDGALLPGEFANISIALSHEANTIMIPSEAVVPKVIGQDVYLNRGGVAALVPVELGMRTDSTVEVTKGLHPGDTLIVRGSMMLYPGTKVSCSKLR